MLYCERCSALYEDCCPFCGKRNGREPQADDLCFFSEKYQLLASVQADILQQEGIPFVQRVSNGIAPLMGANLTTYRFYTRYDLLDRVKEILPEEEE